MVISAEKKQEYKDYLVQINKEVEIMHARTLEFWNIQNGSTIHLVLRLRSIGKFDVYNDTPGIELLNEESQKISNEEVKEIIKEVKSRTGNDLISNNVKSFSDIQLLNNEQCNTLRTYLDNEHINTTKKQGKETQDFQVSFSRTHLEKILGEDSVKKIVELFNGPFSVIKLRRVSLVGQCIKFHTDFTLRTMQIPLNSDFSGGDLVFLEEDGNVMKPQRPPGSATIHDCSIVHGVTRIQSGVRYSLFLLEEPIR